jgi:recombinational DNA repair protein RecR
MVKVRDLIEQARVSIVDASTVFNMDKNLRVSELHDEILQLVKDLEHKRSGGFGSRLKRVMFEDSASETMKEKQLSDSLYQLQNCLKCECVNCPIITENCVCKSCVYGSYTSSCDGVTRVAVTDSDVLNIHGYSNITFHIDILSGRTQANGTDSRGIYKENIPLR